MSIDPRMIDFASRLAELDERIERLETLEYGTLAFPSGGAGIVCDIKLTAPAPSVTCTPIPSGKRHLMAIVSAGIVSPGANPPTGKIRVIGGPLGGAYEYFTRQERRFGVGVPGSFDTDVFSYVGTPAWQTVDPSIVEIALGPTPFRNSVLYFFPDPDLPQVEGADDVSASGIWIGAMQRRVAGFPDISHFHNVDQGGGFKGTIGAITFLTFATTVPDVFLAGSRFTVYGL